VRNGSGVVSRLSIVLVAVVMSALLAPSAAESQAVPAAAASSAESLVPAAAAASSPASPDAPGSPDAPAAGARWTNHSYYVGSPSRDRIRRLGCDQGGMQGRMSLFFGAPVAVGGGVGATLWGGSDQTTSQVGEMIKDFVRGYVLCRRSPNSQLFVGMGTSTSAIDNKSDAWLAVHGRHWANVVVAVNAWAEHHYPGAVRVYGAWDPEPSWSSYHKAERWMRGYAGASGVRGLQVHASADGCPRDTSDNGACNNGWRQDHLWRLAWRFDPALPMPQIYGTSGVNARQWQRIDEYGARHHGDGMVFYGVMSQFGACLQVGGCRGTNLRPEQAHNFMLWYLNANPLTAQPAIETATDVQWHR
jgi:hypothetical protein